jgi:hypothetical protein
MISFSIRLVSPLLLYTFFLAANPFGANAETAEEKGLAIVVEADRRDNGFGDYTADIRITCQCFDF